MKIEELEKELKLGKLNCIYLFHGEEVFLLEACVKKIKKLFGEQIAGINYITIDETNIQNLISDISTPAFGYEKKLIVVKNAGLFKKEGKRKSAKTEGIADKIASYIKENYTEINESNIIIFIDSEVEKNELYNCIDKLGIVCNFEKLKPIAIIKRLKAIVNAYKIVEEDLGYTGALDRYVAEQVESIKWFDRLSTENVYRMLISDPVNVHPYSFFFVKYLYETYGDTILDELIQATNKTFYEKSPEYYGGGSVSDVFTSEDFRDIIISQTSETVLSDYVDWMRANKYN